MTIEESLPASRTRFLGALTALYPDTSPGPRQVKRSPSIAAASRDDQKPDRALLPVPEAVIHEGELARDIAEELEAHAATRAHVPRLRPAHRCAGRRSEVHRVELLAHHVEGAGMRRAAVHHPEAHAIA